MTKVTVRLSANVRSHWLKRKAMESIIPNL